MATQKIIMCLCLQSLGPDSRRHIPSYLVVRILLFLTTEILFQNLLMLGFYKIQASHWSAEMEELV